MSDPNWFLVLNEMDRLRAINAELLAALKGIVDFCDDPHGSEKTESLVMGMARLLPAARSAVAKAEEAP